MGGDSFGDSLRKPKWDELKLSPISKNFYEPSPSVLSRPKEQVEQFRYVAL